MAKLQDYRTLFGDDFGEIAEAFSAGIPPGLEKLLVNVINDVTFSATSFAVNLNATVNGMQQSGMSLQFIEQTLQEQMANGTGPFAALRNNIKKHVTKGINQSSRFAQYQTYYTDESLKELGEKALWIWVTVSGHKICADCVDRAGKEATFREWEQEGLPGAGMTLCTSYCYCMLDPTGKLGDQVKLPKTTPPVKKKELKGLWEKSFLAENANTNKKFIEAFKDSRQKMKEFIAKMPALKHLTNGGSTSYARHKGSQYSSRVKKWLKTKADEDYVGKYGYINIKKLSSKRVLNTITHEYGHFVHSNLHYQWMGRYEVNDYIKAYRRSKMSAKDFVAANHYNKPEMKTALLDLLKFDDACVASKKRMGIPGRTKAAKETLTKSQNFYNELIWRTRDPKGSLDTLYDYYGETQYTTKGMVKYKDIYNQIDPKTSKLLKQLIKDKDTDELGYLLDLVGALTKEKVGQGHGVGYYTKRGFVSGQHHETFANLTCFYSHKNPVYWEFISEKFPELAKYYEDMIDQVVNKEYFGH